MRLRSYGASCSGFLNIFFWHRFILILRKLQQLLRSNTREASRDGVEVEVAVVAIVVAVEAAELLYWNWEALVTLPWFLAESKVESLVTQSRLSACQS